MDRSAMHRSTRYGGSQEAFPGRPDCLSKRSLPSLWGTARLEDLAPIGPEGDVYRPVTLAAGLTRGLDEAAKILTALAVKTPQQSG
jgi:hypothetical protein